MRHLQRVDRNAAGAERQQRVSGSEWARSVEAVPHRDTRAGQRRGLCIAQVIGKFEDAHLAERAILRRHAVNTAAQRPGRIAVLHFTRHPALAVQRCYPVAHLERGHAATHLDHLAGAVAQRNNHVLLSARELPRHHHQIAKVERSGVHLDEHLPGSDARHGKINDFERRNRFAHTVLVSFHG